MGRLQEVAHRADERRPQAQPDEIHGQEQQCARGGPLVGPHVLLNERDRRHEKEAVEERGPDEEGQGKANLPVRAGSHFYLIDGRRPVRIRVSPGFSHLRLLLPRQRVIGITGRDPFAAGAPFVELASRSLLGIAAATMQSLVIRIKELEEADMAAAVHVLSGLAVTGLRRQLGIPGDGDRPSAHDALFLTACRLIEVYYADRHLAGSTMAAAAGCSRAHLYRAFAGRGTTFANVLRDVRLSKAKGLLISPRPRSIAQVAALTGYADQSSFSRAFHAAVGVTPREWCRAAETLKQKV